MKICLVTPAAPGSKQGNRVTALRWARLLRQLGHHVVLAEGAREGAWDVVIALHARRSHAAIRAFREKSPTLPIVVMLTGTDLYRDLATSPEAQESLALATRLVVLQPRGLASLPLAMQTKTRAILQSAQAPDQKVERNEEAFEVCVLAHLRAVKDPLRAAEAAKRLPPSSHLRILHVGGALDPELAALAQAAERETPRYRWLGEKPRSFALALLARCRLLVVTSLLEGGANVISEALACGVPVISTRIAGSIGQLGEEYPGYFEVGDTDGLAGLLARAERDPDFYRSLAEHCARLAPLVDPVRERRALRQLLAELAPPPGNRLRFVEGAAEDERAALARDVQAGLDASPRRLACRYFYDDEGSLLFEAICELPEYYLPRAEREILRAHAGELAELTPPGTRLIELGSGNAQKTRLLLAPLLARGRLARYVPVDISRAALDESARALLHDFPSLQVTAVAAEYEPGLAWLASEPPAPQLFVWLGSNIGNFDRHDAASFLARVRRLCRPGDRLLLGVDLRKQAATLEAAYDDARGVTARFNLNLLSRLNRELGADFALEGFRHRARYDETRGRIEMFLDSTRAQSVRIAALDRSFHFAAGEAIHTESSHKYSFAELDALAAASGFAVIRRFTDGAGRFCTALFEPPR